jgi:hypothetical protein
LIYSPIERHRGPFPNTISQHFTLSNDLKFFCGKKKKKNQKQSEIGDSILAPSKKKEKEMYKK